MRRVRAIILGTAKKPRIAVLRSNFYTSAQLIDDEKSHTLAHASSRELKNTGKIKTSKTEAARLAGERLAKKALDIGIKEAVFDRRAYKYHGRVRAFAEGARKAGLKI